LPNGNGEIDMDKSELLFADAYENFYQLVEQNKLFSTYCEKVFGIDFSQDGFSDIAQVKDLMTIAKIKEGDTVLDIGCGNGKLAEYISDTTGATVYGFDYSDNAILAAKDRTRNKPKLHFEMGLIGEIQFPTNKFDVIISVDTMYFAKDMSLFVSQIMEWLKPGGCFLSYYGEGHMEKRRTDMRYTELAYACNQLGLNYKELDYTRSHYELMKHKRAVISSMKKEFLFSNMAFYYLCAMDQSINKRMRFEKFQKKYNRFLYVVNKP
jgi:2-polyprenyl-3-methyl-5-hydroxy-6-metoxy-1,4-benzoquinol methylase